MHVDDPTPHAHIDNAGRLRDVFAATCHESGLRYVVESTPRELFEKVPVFNECQGVFDAPLLCLFSAYANSKAVDTNGHVDPPLENSFDPWPPRHALFKPRGMSGKI